MSVTDSKSVRSFPHSLLYHKNAAESIYWPGRNDRRFVEPKVQAAIALWYELLFKPFQNLDVSGREIPETSYVRVVDVTP